MTDFIDAHRLVYLRTQVDAERMSWGEVAELQSAFERIDPDTLPEPAENAGFSDMLDELEARTDEPLPVLIGVINSPMFGTPASPHEYVDWSRPDFATEEEWTEILGCPVEEFAATSTHMIVFTTEC